MAGGQSVACRQLHDHVVKALLYHCIDAAAMSCMHELPMQAAAWPHDALTRKQATTSSKGSTPSLHCSSGLTPASPPHPHPVSQAVRTSKEIVTKQKAAIVGKFAADKKV